MKKIFDFDMVKAMVFLHGVELSDELRREFQFARVSDGRISIRIGEIIWLISRNTITVLKDDGKVYTVVSVLPIVIGK